MSRIGRFATTDSLVVTDALSNKSHNTVNYNQQPVTTYNGKQYITYLNSTGDVMVGVRAFPSGAWSTFDTGFNTSNITDTHFNTGFEVDADGFLHIVYDVRNSVLKYARSNNPEDPSAWTARNMIGTEEATVGYPRFFKVGSTLFFSYRSPGALPSVQYLNVYDNTEQTWTRIGNPFITGEGVAGVYCDSFWADQFGRLHVTFAWRTNNSPVTLVDPSYAYSDDLGATWKQVDGTDQTVPITRANAGKIIDGTVAGFINQNNGDSDNQQRPHYSYWRTVNGRIQCHHAFWNGTSWSHNQVTSYYDSPGTIVTFIEEGMARPRVIIDQSNNVAYYFTRQPAGGDVVMFRSAPPYNTYDKFRLGTLSGGKMEFGSVDLDWYRANRELYYLNQPNAMYTAGPIFVSRSSFVQIQDRVLTTGRVPATGRVSRYSLPNYILSLSPVAYYTPETGDTTAINRVNPGVYDGTINGATIVDGLVGKAWYMDGVSDFIDLGVPAGFNTATRSIVGLVKPESSMPGEMHIISNDDSASGNRIIQFKINTDYSARCAVFRAGNVLDGDYFIGSVTVDEPVLLAVTMGSGTLKAYINGSLVLTRGIGTLQSTANNKWWINRRRSIDSNVGKGYMQHLQFYDKILSEAEILQMAQLAGLA